MTLFFLTVIGLLCFLSPSHADTVMIPMRDGIHLNTIIDFPPFFPAGKKSPVVLERSPYGHTKEELIALVFAELLGYIGIRQDQRGTGDSEGGFGIWHDSVNDTYDTLEWVGNQTWFSGEAFITGVSADAIDAVCTISHPHPSVRAQVIIFATSQAWETFYVGGAYREALIDGWLGNTVRSQAPALIDFVHTQESPALPWWNTVNGTKWFQNINVPSIHWAGWYDIFQNGHLAAWRGYQSHSSLPGQAKLVIDPCGHCQDAAEYFPQNAILGRAALPLLMALELLADDSVTNRSWPLPAEGVKNVTFYVMGADEGKAPGNYWTTLEDFPVPVPTSYFLGADGSLSTSMPTTPGSLSFHYDPSDPVMSVGGDNLEIKCGPLDQRVIEKLHRQDVLIFTTPPLTAPLAITGGPEGVVFMSTNVTDTDITYKLIDVYPPNDSDPFVAGASTLVLDGISRMKWRNWRENNAEALLSGNTNDIYSTRVGLWNTSYVFQTGHSIRVHVSSSNHPRFRPNPNTGISFDTNNKTAATTIYMNAQYPSHIQLPVVQLDQLPRFPIEKAVDALAAKFQPQWEALQGGLGGEKADVSLVNWLGERFEKAMELSSFAA